MVVSRRNPVVPPPVSSRTNSAQAIPRKQKQAQAPSPLVDEKPKLRVRRTRPRVKRPPRTLSLFDRLFLFSLFSFVAYAATVCSSPWSTKTPVPYHEQPQLCRALTTYRTAILEPYVVPSLKVAYEHTLGHPIVQAQYVAHVQPHLSTIKARSQPIVDAASQINQRVIQPTVNVVYGKVWKAYVVPWYYRAYLPRYRMYVAPRLQAGWEHGVKAPLKPYTDVAQRYARDAQVYVHTHIIHKARAWYSDTVYPTYATVRPKVIKTYETLKPTLCKAYRQAKAGLETAWVYAKPYLIKGWVQTRAYVGVAVTEGGKARRTYVDPHVHKILERVRVSGEGSSSVTASATPVVDEGSDDEVTFEEDPTPTYESVPEPTPTEIAEEETIVDVTVTPQAVEPEDVAPPSASPIEIVTDEYDQVTASATPTPSPSPVAVSKEDEEQEELRRVVSVAEQSAGGHAPSSTADAEQPVEAEESGPAKDVEEDIRERLADEFVEKIKEMKRLQKEREDAYKAALNAGDVTPTASSATESAAATPTAVVEDESELDDFLSDLGFESLGNDGASASSPEDQVEFEAEPEPEQPSEEELLAAKKAETARKRADIVGRHVEWQRQLDELAEENWVKVVDGIEGVRVWGASELGEEYLDASAATDRGAYKKVERAEGEEGLGKKTLGGVEKQGQKFLKGLETYLGKATKRSANWKVAPADSDTVVEEKAKKAGEEQDKWDELVGKVNERFNTAVTGAQAEVHQWYLGMKGKEVEVILELIEEVKLLSGRAQADIAMDYSWLDDVTWQDWQNYHDLMRTFERFEMKAITLQNGSYVPESGLKLSSPDPLIKALDKLQADLNDIVLGFKLSVTGLSKQATKLFSTKSEGEGSDGFFAVKHAKGELVDDMRGMPEYKGSEKPAVSILPINPRPSGGEDGSTEKVRDAAAILVGKDAKQVEEALERASALGEGVRSVKSRSEEEL